MPPESNQGLGLDLVFFCGELLCMGSHFAHEEGPSLGEQCRVQEDEEETPLPRD